MTDGASPGDFAALLDRARSCVATGRRDEALTVLGPILATEPLHGDALTLFAAVASELGRVDDLAALAHRIHGLQPHSPDVQNICGSLLAAVNRLDLAAPYLQAAADLDPSPQRLTAAAASLLAAGRRDEAAGYARHAALLGQSGPDLASLIAVGAGPERVSDGPRRIVVVTAIPDPREAKIGHAIRAAGSQAILLSSDAPTFDPATAFDQAFRFGTPAEALQMARQLDADLLHVCTQMNYETCQVLVAHRPAPVVVDSYDILTGMWTEAFFEKFPQFDSSRRIERFCLETADGLCLRGLQTQALRRKHGYVLQQPSVFWPEYAWNNRAPAQKLGDDDGKLHVVFSGAVHPADSPHDWMAEMLDGFGVHLHIYPMGGPPDRTGFEERFAPYVELDRRLEHFHLYQPVPQPDWLAALDRYDVMIHVLRFLFETDTGEHYTRDKLRLTYANKWADCLDTNVFYLAHDFMLLAHLAARTGTGAGVDWGTLHDRSFWEGLNARARGGGFDWSAQRAALSVDANAPRLMQFYKRVIERAGARARINRR